MCSIGSPAMQWLTVSMCSVLYVLVAADPTSTWKLLRSGVAVCKKLVTARQLYFVFCEGSCCMQLAEAYLPCGLSEMLFFTTCAQQCPLPALIACVLCRLGGVGETT